MHSGPRRITFRTSGVLLVAALALTSCGGSGGGPATTSEYSETTFEPTPAVTDTTAATATPPPAPKPTEVRVVVANGRPEGGIVRKTVGKGERVVLVVASDVADEVHLHGYDLTRNVSAGGTVRIRFRAHVPGRFEIELEDRGLQIAELTVEP